MQALAGPKCLFDAASLPPICEVLCLGSGVAAATDSRVVQLSRAAGGPTLCSLTLPDAAAPALEMALTDSSSRALLAINTALGAHVYSVSRADLVGQHLACVVTPIASRWRALAWNSSAEILACVSQVRAARL